MLSANNIYGLCMNLVVHHTCVDAIVSAVPHVSITVIIIGASFPIQIMNVILMCMHAKRVCSYLELTASN